MMPNLDGSIRLDKNRNSRHEGRLDRRKKDEILLGTDESQAAFRAHRGQDDDGNSSSSRELVAVLGTTGGPQTVRDIMLARFSALDEHSRHHGADRRGNRARPRASVLAADAGAR